MQHYEEENAYDERDLEFLTSVGSQIAMAIERKRGEQALFAANKRALSDYESLVERIAALGRTLGTARDLKIIFRALRDFAGGDAGLERIDELQNCVRGTVHQQLADLGEVVGIGAGWI